MKDIKELIFAAVEENAVKFQEMTNDLLHARAYEAIEALRPEVSASMFGEEKESKKKGNESCDDMDDEDDSGEVDEELKGNQHKIDKNKNGKIDAHDFKLLRKEEVEQIDERSREEMISQIKGLKKKAIKHGFDWPTDDSTHNVSTKDLKDFHKSVRSVIKQELRSEEVEADEKKVANRIAHARGSLDVASRPPLYKGVYRRKGEAERQRAAAEKEMDDAHAEVKKTSVAKFLQTRKGNGKVRTEEVVNEVAPPKNQADWQALINHQIKVTGHPVATDAQFRATTVGKDTTKIASQEPGEDKMNYAKAQGGAVKQ